MKKLNDLVNKYSYNINYDADDDVYIGNCAEIPSIQAHGNDPDSALTEIRKAVLGALKWMEKDKQTLPEPFSLHKFSGEFRVRMPPEKHRKVAIEAALQGISMNQLIVSKL
ncbi:MAG: hypothetical protein A2381_05505 [Bdellovibrionales bacterium RIFOXYB1_FULL_37_110]|nr:MAG: hypothetical protein A2381_05505 [Bdellovibrionales bacterium RIFOXYB1_FULL_37_110]